MVDLLADPVKVPQDEGEGEGVHHSGVQPLPVDPDVDPQGEALAEDGVPLEAKELYAGVNGGGGVLLLLGLEDRELPGGQDIPARHQQQVPHVRQLRQHLAGGGSEDTAKYLHGICQVCANIGPLVYVHMPHHITIHSCIFRNTRIFH